MQGQENPQQNQPSSLHIPLSQSRINTDQRGYAPSNETFTNVAAQQMGDMMQQGDMGYPSDDVYLNDSGDEGGNYEIFDDFPLDALAFNQGLAAYAGYDDDGGEHKAQKLKEARLLEALGKQTSLLDNIAQSYKKNKEIRDKAELRKLKNRLEKLEAQKMFRELEIQQSQMANDIATQNNQLIFSHINAQAQLRANPIILNVPGPQSASNLNPLILHAALRTMSNKNTKSYSGLPSNPMYSRPMPPYPMVGGPGMMFPGPGGPFGGMASPIFNPKAGGGSMSMMPFGSPPGKKSVKLPPISHKKAGNQSYDDRLDVKKYMNKVFANRR